MPASTARLPLILGHRGASAHAPENTLAAFRLACAQGADGIELDVKLSADGAMVVIHDQTVDRTTGGSGKVNSLKLEEIKRLDAGSFFSPAFKGEPIPTLEEVFAAVGQDLLINVELTNYASLGDALPELAADLIRRMGLESKVIISSFSPFNLVRFQRRLPGLPLGLLTMPGPAGVILRTLTGWLTPRQALHPHFSDVTPALVARYHRRGRKVNVWTVDQPEEMNRLAALRVDAIITDDPALACQVMGRAG